MDDDDPRFDWVERGPTLVRDSLLFLGGLVGFIVVLLSPELRDPGILVLLAGMMGLPAFLQGKDDG